MIFNAKLNVKSATTNNPQRCFTFYLKFLKNLFFVCNQLNVVEFFDSKKFFPKNLFGLSILRMFSSDVQSWNENILSTKQCELMLLNQYTCIAQNEWTHTQSHKHTKTHSHFGLWTLEVVFVTMFSLCTQTHTYFNWFRLHKLIFGFNEKGKRIF